MAIRRFTFIASINFAVMAIVHVIRLFTYFHFIAGSHVIPIWESWLGVVIPGILAWGTYRESRR